MPSILKREPTADAKQAPVGQTPIDRKDAVQRIRSSSDSPARGKI